MPERRPTIFVSSTVYDFQDLRSALKHHLEGFGFAVQMSELADFDKPIEQNSYEACFAAIRSADVFVLLVGGRRGGWYRKDDRVSITQAEYRVAYEESGRRNLPIVACVRRSIWDQLAYAGEIAGVRGPATAAAESLGASIENPDRAGAKNGVIRRALVWARTLLNQQLHTHGVLVSDGQASTRREPSNKFIDDPEHAQSFLDEIRRVEEMKLAVGAGHALPRANWIHLFGSYSELIDALKIALRVRRGVAGELLLDQVCDELNAYCGQFLSKSKGRVLSRFDGLTELIRSLRISTNTHIRDPSAMTTVTAQQVATLAAVSLAATIHTRHPLPALEAATISPMLAEYDPVGQLMSQAALQRACRRSLVAIRRAEEREDLARQARSALLREGAGSRAASSWELSAFTIVSVLGYALDTARALAEAENVVAHIKCRAPLQEAPAAGLPLSPIEDMVASLEAESVTSSEFYQWVQSRAAQRGAAQQAVATDGAEPRS
jgi:hypothetical protein